VRPDDIAPHRALGVVLVEQVVPSLVVQRPCSFPKFPNNMSAQGNTITSFMHLKWFVISLVKIRA
jgi:hypothetical protein